MKKALMLAVLIVLTRLVPNDEGFAEYSCGGQEVTSAIVRALGWKLLDELLTLEIGRLASGSSETRCTSIGGQFLSLLKASRKVEVIHPYVGRAWFYLVGSRS